LQKQLRPSPHFDDRPDMAVTDMLILHYTGMKDLDSALDRLCDAASKVSSHYVVDEAGHIYSLVDESKRAWHAGASFWNGRTDINSCSIGIEIVNPGHEHGYREFPDVQIKAVIALCSDICTRHIIPSAHFLAHSDVAPSRKQDPGEKFPWNVLHAHGLGHWVPPAPLGGGRFFQSGDEGQPVEALQAMLALYGYGLDITGKFDAITHDVVVAFQRHFRQARVDGVADESTIITLRNILGTRAG
jgi:N-acetylmuramoyl-L-alanine amidase